MRLLKVGGLAMLLFMAGLAEAWAQVPSGQPMYRVSRSFTAATLTAQGPGTVNSPDIAAAGFNGVVCFYNQASHTGTVTGVTITIYNKDVASGNYLSVLASAGYTADAEAASIQAGGGLAATANVSSNSLLSNTIRVAVTEAGAGSTVTGTVWCVLR